MECLKPVFAVSKKLEIDESKTPAKSYEEGTEKLAENEDILNEKPKLDAEKKTTSGPKYFCSKCGFPVCDEKCK
jgi:hypothetical protein